MQKKIVLARLFFPMLFALLIAWPGYCQIADETFKQFKLELKTGMVLAIEPMVNEGTYKVRVLDNGWTVVTQDGKLSAHFEHSVAITRNGPDILSMVH